MARNRLYGIGEPVTMSSLNGHIDAMKALDLMAAVGVTSFREWMHIPVILENPTTPKPEVVAAFTKTLDRCVELDIEVTGMSHCWFLPEECNVPKSPFGNSAMPQRDLTPGSVYMKTLEMLETSWETMVSLFPQVPQWEVGNEWNLPIFLRPVGWKPEPGQHFKGGFTHKEAMLVAADMMYYSARGIRKANPNAKVVSFSPCVHGGIPMEWRDILPPGCAIAITFDTLYRIIKGGESFSTNSDDYFDMLAWHPYLSTQMGYAPVDLAYPATEKGYHYEEMPDALWKSGCDLAYNVMAKYGDGHKKVLITEFGFSDAGDPEREKAQAELIRDTFRIAEQMPYLHSLHFFRLFEHEEAKGLGDDKKNQSSPQEAHFGIFREPHHDYEPRTKAKVLQEVYGGTGDLAAIGLQK